MDSPTGNVFFLVSFLLVALQLLIWSAVCWVTLANLSLSLSCALIFVKTHSILWPLFHYHPGEISFNEEDWGAYQQANSLFAKAISEIVRDGDLVWVQDYHLMLLPRMLREEVNNQRVGDAPAKNIKIGFFLHTPFPSSEVYR